MIPFQDNLQPIHPPQRPTPPFSQLLLFIGLLGWLAASPVVVGLIQAFLPATWPALVGHLVVIGLLAGLLLIPLGAFAGLVRWQGWENTWPLALALLVTGLYILIDVMLRAIAAPGSPTEVTLRLPLLTLVTLGLGGLALKWAGVPLSPTALSRTALNRASGLTLPSLAGLLAALVIIAGLTLGWPMTGALGDRWVSLRILGQTLAASLPEEIFFRGAILGLLLYHFRSRQGVASLAALLTYVAFTPSLIVPHQDWGKLGLLVTALPFAWLLIELRLLTGSIWPGLLLIWAYRAAPLLFADPRVELPLITQPWQMTAQLWMILGAGGVALVLSMSRHWLVPRWRWPGLVTTGIALVVALLSWGLWGGLWLTVGRPGFYDDGFLIIMAEQADLSEAEAIDDLIARRTFVRDRLIETATRTQAPVREALEAAGVAYRPFYLINMIRVEGHHGQMADFANLPGVARVMLNPNVRPYPQQVSFGYGAAPTEPQGVGENVRQVQADQVWALGFTGQGIVVAGQDTGYEWQHPALQRAYRGYQASGEVNHDYNWHDAWSDTPTPFDDDQHGTHTMGTILGDDGQGNQIGLAPGAQWIGCRNMQRGLGNPASYADCMEFFLAPYPVGGDPFTDGDVTLAPHVVNNSWGCPDVEGCDDTVLEPATLALRAAGIMMVVSAGNEGSSCQTVSEPPARYDAVFSVGATDSTGTITDFSSRGPVSVEGPVGATHASPLPPLLKPDIVAPGGNIRSSVPGGGYGTASGTSMAGPHVAGLVALIWSAQPALIGQIEATEEIIRQSAQPVELSATCSLPAYTAEDAALLAELESLEVGGVCACGDKIGSPNNVYGWGQIDALAAVKLALSQE